MNSTNMLVLSLLLLTTVSSVQAWILPTSSRSVLAHRTRPGALSMVDDKAASDNGEGADLAAEFFKMAQSKGIGLDANDLLEDDEDEDDDEEDEEDMNIPQGAVNAFLGYDTGITSADDTLAGNVSLTNDQLYSEVKERVLDTAGGFVDYVQGARDEEEDDSEDEDSEDEETTTTPQAYQPPTTIPDSELTAGEVVLLVLQALRHNAVPTENRGVEILFGFSSPTSQIKTTDGGLTPAEYASFLHETEYKVLFLQDYTATIEKADYSANGQKAFMTARLTSTGSIANTVHVNFILSACRMGATTTATEDLFRTTSQDDNSGKGPSDDSCWLVDSMLIRPESMRRRRRK